ncbi:MAG: hypothetical protein AB4041_18275 [Microcystaceae cyanobacterium]
MTKRFIEALESYTIMVSKLEKQLKIRKVNPTLATLLNELVEECETVLFLLNQLRLYIVVTIIEF